MPIHNEKKAGLIVAMMAASVNRRATVHLGKRARYEGRVHDEERHGLGTLFIDEGDGEESALRVTWRHDVPHGVGSLVEPDGGRVSGHWYDGELRGLVREEYADGSLRYIGRYAQGERSGEGVQVGADGGCLVGSWAAGALHGQCCAYLYPDAAEGLALLGEWRHGRMHRARRIAMPPTPMPRPTPPPPPPAAAHGHTYRLPHAAVHPALESLLALCTSAPGALLTALRALHGLRATRGADAPEYRCHDDARSPHRSPHRAAIRPGSREALTRDPYEARRVCVRASERILDGLTDVGDGLFAIRELRPGEVVAFFGGGVRLGPSTLEACQEADECAAEDRNANNSTLEHEACEEADECDAEDRDANDSDGDAECERGADKGCGDDAVVDSVDAAHVAAARAEPDWGTVAADGTFIWLPEAWRDCSSYVASLGHKANHAGWRANCELVPFEHPRLGQCSALRVLSGGGGGGGGVGEGVAEGTELTVCYAHLVTLPAGSRPAWLCRLLELRAEEGYYAHLAFTPPRTLLRCRSSIAANGRLRVVSHGPWRVLWFDGVEQGMTYHEPDGRLLPAVVGFDYQRTMVSAAAALISTGLHEYRTHQLSSVLMSTGPHEPPAEPCATGLPGRPKASIPKAITSKASAHAPPLPKAITTKASMHAPPSILVVGLGAGSCAAALMMALGALGSTSQVEVVEIDEAVVHAAVNVHGLSVLRRGGGTASAQHGGIPTATTHQAESSGGAHLPHRLTSSFRASVESPPPQVPRVPVILSDAASHVHGLAAGTLDCVLLDAYDAKGRVPTHLQAVPFVRALGTALAPGGCVIANLWHGTADARAAAHGFAQLLDRDAGLRSWALPVVGHEKNCILIALRPKDGRSIATSKAELRRRLLHAAAAYAAAPEMEPAMLKTMRANADTIEAWAVG